jgi:broad specificity phosphatase PhoE
MQWEPFAVSTQFLLVRHARTIWNDEQRYAGHQDVPLAPEADSQIRTLTRKLVHERIDAIYSSPLSRCLLTVAPIAEIMDLPIHLDVRLRERDLGSWENQAAADLAQQHPGFVFPDSAYTDQFVIPGAEPLESVKERMEAVLSDIGSHWSGSTVLIATHAGTIWAAENRLATNHPLQAEWPSNSGVIRLAWRERSGFKLGTP